jgi:hypothetical protein
MYHPQYDHHRDRYVSRDYQDLFAIGLMISTTPPENFEKSNRKELLSI